MAPSVYVSKIIHKTFINVNEKGTEAAAATMGVMVFKLAHMIDPVMPVEFRCNRPFIFVIHEKATKGILFVGKFMKP